MILFWHIGVTAVLSALAAGLGRRMLYWRHAATG